MKRGIDRLKQAWEENPIQVIIVGALAATAAAKLLDASTARANSRAWQKEVDRRIIKNYR